VGREEGEGREGGSGGFPLLVVACEGGDGEGGREGGREGRGCCWCWCFSWCISTRAINSPRLYRFAPAPCPPCPPSPPPSPSFPPSLPPPSTLSNTREMGQAKGKRQNMRHQTRPVIRAASFSWFGPLKTAEGTISYGRREGGREGCVCVGFCSREGGREGGRDMR